MPLVDGPEGYPVEIRVTGSGEPVTVFGHGLAESIDETRPFGSGVPGTRVFFHFRGHGATVGPEESWTYAGLAEELRAVADRFGARRALGVSLGAGALLRACWLDPRRFDRVVFVLPGMIDRPRSDPAIERMLGMAALIEQRDAEGLADALVAQQPVGARTRPDVQLWAARRAQRLLGTTVGRGMRELPLLFPVPTGADLSSVDVPALVIGQRGDEAHPFEVADELASRLPHATLRIFDEGGLIWAHRTELRALLSTFLAP